MKILRETVTLQDTLNLLDVRGRDYETLVLSRGKPLAINWHDCGGSVAQYLVRAGVPDFEADLRYVLEGNVAPNDTLANQFQLFLQLLAPGTYMLVFGSRKVGDLIEPAKDWDPANDYEHFYPIEEPLILTQPTSSLERSTIREYEAKIKSGQRPIALAVAAEESWCNYVVDGHHKLVAYRKLNTKPTVLTAYRVSAPPLPRDSFEKWFSARHPLASHYKKNKPK